LNIRISREILQFFLDRFRPGLFLHFELIPDRLPESLKELITQFPPGSLQFEVGIQTFNDVVSQLISREQDNDIVEQNLKWLRKNSSVHVHADLIVGLPGESLESFAQGFDRLVLLQPQEIQVGILKRLRGTPITRHDTEWEMIYSPHPPYEILQTKLVDFATMQQMRRFAKNWDLIANSGNFSKTLSLILCQTDGLQSVSPFVRFHELSEWLYSRTGQSHGIALSRLIELVFEYVTTVQKLGSQHVAQVMWDDYHGGGRSDKPICLRPYLPEKQKAEEKQKTEVSGPKRQQRHRNRDNS